MGILDAPAVPLATMTDPATVLPRVTITTVSGVDPTDTETYLNATITINGTQPMAASSVRVRGRGNSTWTAPKKPWRLNFAAATSVLGLPADRDWALMANYFDPISLRTALAMELGVRSSGLSFTPKFRYVELTMNGTYRGVYQLGELVRFGTSRVQGPKASGTSGLPLTGTYLLEWDNRLDAVASFRTTAKSVPIILDDPDGTTAEHKTYIQAWINNFEATLYGANWLDPSTGYARLIDMPSWVDWYMVNELLMNVDSNGFSSIKMVKTRDTADTPGRLYLGPLWDFDRSLGFGNTGPTGWWTRSAIGQPDAGHLGMIWIDRMYSDPAFTAMLYARWATLKPQIVAHDSVDAVVDRITDRLFAALGRDRRKWSYSADTATLSDTARAWLHDRIAWLNTQWVADTTAPSIPTNFGAAPGNAQVVLAWTASTDDRGVVKYRLRRGGTVVAEPAGTSYTDAGLANGTAQSYTLSAVDAAGNESAQTAAVTATPSSVTDTTPPTAPSGLTATSGNAQVALTWTASTDNIGVAKYRVRRAGVIVAEPTGTSTTITGLTNGTAYSFTVSALDAVGNESTQSSSVSATPTGPAAMNIANIAGAVPICSVMSPQGGGNKNLEVIRDGLVAATASGDPNLQSYDTLLLSKTSSAEDYFGYTFAEVHTFTKLVFDEGREFNDGGWFTTLRVEIRQGGTWNSVAYTASPTYPLAADGVPWGRYTFNLNTATTGDGIRIIGLPGGSARFTSCSELQAFA